MGARTIKLPDVGEGIAEAELVEWHVKVGDIVREDDLIVTVMTDKAAVEIPSPHEGRVVWIGGDVGDTVAIGSILAKLDGGGAGTAEEPVKHAPAAEAAVARTSVDAARADVALADPSPAILVEKVVQPAPPARHPAMANAGFRPPGEKPLASPAVRFRAREAGVDLRQVQGTGPARRITHRDLDAFLSGPRQASAPKLAPKTAVTDVKVVGLRRRIAEKMSRSKSRIPHITIVEEVDVSRIEDMRASLNGSPTPARPKLTLLPFLMRAMVRALGEQPQLNALFDDDAGVVHQHAGVHIGIATQTPSGLVVPVVKHVEARNLWECALELNRLAARARDGAATRDDLTGSTITVTSLGALGGLATTPVINHPEVAIVGVNKIATRPIWDGAAFVPRKMMNLSASFDHRVIDGWDAAVFLQRLKELLESPAVLLIDV